MRCLKPVSARDREEVSGGLDFLDIVIACVTGVNICIIIYFDHCKKY